ncbi:MAG: hypothetical protein EBT86_10145 [Actinobacteria bacterium]|nr:hypothetical protein [Actinomycetota bacterium]
MEITLRRANSVQNQINEVLKSLNFDYLISVNEFENAEQAIESAAINFSENIKRRERLLEALYAIRKNVGSANISEGIDIRMADAAHLEKQIKFYTDLMDAKIRLSKEVIEGKINRIRTTENVSRMYREEGIQTTIFVQQDLVNFKNIVNFARKKRQKIQDEILELNTRVTIGISNEVEKTLKDEGII